MTGGAAKGWAGTSTSPCGLLGRGALLVILLSLSIFSASCEWGEREGALAGRSAEDFYDGVRLDIIVPFGLGGGTDTWARMIAPYLQRELGQGSSIQIINIPGASSIAGANDFAVRRSRGGRTALVSAGSTFFAYLLGEPMVQYDFRDFTAILSSPVGGVVFIRPEMGIHRPVDLLQPRERLVYGGIAASGNDLLPLLAFELLGLEVLPVLGYGSKGSTRIAFEQGETNIEYQTAPAYRSNVVPLVDEGLAVPLFSFGLMDARGEVVRDPVVPDLPTLVEFYEQMHGSPPSGPAWEAYRAALIAGIEMQKVLWLHGEAPPQAAEALRRAAARVVQDPEFLATLARRMGDYPFYVGDEVEQLFREAVDISPETLAWLHDLLRDRFGIDWQ